MILFVGDVFEPIDDFAIETFLDGEVGHGGGGRGAVPMFFAGRKPDDVSGANFLDGTAPALGAAATGGDDERLAERMGMPSGAGAGLESDGGAGGARRRAGLKEWIDADRASEPIGGAFVGGG